MSAEDIAYWRLQHGLTQQQLADLLGVTRLTVARWETNVQQSPFFLKLALERLDQLLAEATEAA